MVFGINENLNYYGKNFSNKVESPVIAQSAQSSEVSEANTSVKKTTQHRIEKIRKIR